MSKKSDKEKISMAGIVLGLLMAAYFLNEPLEENAVTPEGDIGFVVAVVIAIGSLILYVSD